MSGTMLKKFLITSAAVLVLAACQSGDEAGAGTGAGGGNMGGGGGGGMYGTNDPNVDGRPMDGWNNSDAGAMQELQQVGDRVYFGFDQYDLSAEARETLRRQSEWLGQNGRLTVVVEGHADERGTREYNLALGERRAATVKNYMAALGVDASRVSVISYGEERPAMVGSAEEAWAANRRGVTVLGQ
jgi:peptidoglycan-associated lipoprotein